MVGMIFGVDATGHCLALATICFAGALSAGLGLATVIFLIGSAFATLMLLRFGRLKTALAISQDTTISILAPAVILAASITQDPPEAKIATAFAVIGVSAVLSGLAFWVLGWLRLGRLLRMFPFPVAAGFLASSGYLLIYAALSILTGAQGLIEMAAAMAEPAVALRLIPAVAMALTLVLSIRLIGGTLPVLILVFLFLAGFYIAGYAFGLTHTDMVALGQLPSVPTGTGNGLGVDMLSQIHWPAVLTVAPTLAVVVMLNLMGLLLNVSGVELATRADVNENHELQVAGGANVLIGLLGGLTAYLQGGASIIVAKLGVQRGPMLGGYIATVCAAAFLAPWIVASVPVFIPAAMLMFIGLAMLGDWLLGTLRRLTFVDWLIVLIIVLATALVGILPAIGIGLGLALIGFAYASIRMPIIRHSTSVAKRRSIRDRSALHGEALQRDGHRIRILHLQGPLFFGSVEQLITHLRRIIADDPAVDAVILDFAEVYSFDSSACVALDKLAQQMQAQGIAAHLTGVSKGLHAVFVRWGLRFIQPNDVGPGFGLWADLDAAIEHCESALLAQGDHLPEEADIARILFDLGRQHPRIPDLIAQMQTMTLAQGAHLIRAADQPGDVFIVASGRLSVHLPPQGTGRPVRVRVLGPGAIVGEIAYMTGQPRNADVIADVPTAVLCLSAPTIRQIEAEDRDLAAVMMSIFSRSLASKLALTNDLLIYAQSAVATGT